MSILKKVTDASLPYLISFPPNGKGKLPVLFFLHGRNLCANPDDKDAAKNLDLLLQDGIPSMLTHYSAGGAKTVAPTSDFDDASALPNPAAVKLIAETFITISPQHTYAKDKSGKVLTDDARWGVGQLKSFCAEMLAKYKNEIDESRVYLTGLSMGGGGAWSLALAEPTMFTAMLPVCAGGNAARVAAIKDLPVWCHMGTHDEIVPVKAVDELMEALRKVNNDVGYSRYPGFPHQIWAGVYSDMRVWKWLLSKKKGAASKM